MPQHPLTTNITLDFIQQAAYRFPSFVEGSGQYTSVMAQSDIHKYMRLLNSEIYGYKKGKQDLPGLYLKGVGARHDGVGPC